MTSHIQQVRRFNRAVSQRLGTLDDDFLSRGRPLSEARIIFEIGSNENVSVQALREALELDSGYLSRILRSLEKQELIITNQDNDDRRVRRLALTPQGHSEFHAYDKLSDKRAQQLLSNFSQDKSEKLIQAMQTVEKAFSFAAMKVGQEHPSSTDALWCLEQYYAELSVRFDTFFDPDAGKIIDSDDMRPPLGCFVIARLDGKPVGCGALVRLEADIGEIKRVWVDNANRGFGAATKIMNALEKLAHDNGYKKIRLDTNKTLLEAQTMYTKRGYTEIARYNENPYAHHFFEKAL